MENLDATFSALADPTRRAILKRLARGSATVNELAKPFPISQPAISRHLKVLERAGLVDRKADEQRRLASLNAENLRLASGWLEYFATFWPKNFDQLDGLLSDLKKEPNHD